MLVAGAVLALVLSALVIAMGVVAPAQLWAWILAGWFALGAAYSMSVTPGGRLLRRSANPEDRPALFAAQFALSHGCWLIAYPLTGWLGAGLGQAWAFAGMAMLAAIGILLGASLWPSHDPEVVPHTHDDLSAAHPHVRSAHGDEAARHPFVIDDLHPQWPSRL